MKALILVNGELYRPDVLRRRIQADKFDMVIAADAGADYAAELGVLLDAIIGDMDSLACREKYCNGSTEIITYPAEKDETDLELAVLYAVKKKADDIVLVGAIGGRMDMTLANMMLLAHPFSAARLEIWHGEQTCRLIRPPGADIRGQAGDLISLMPVGGDARGVVTEGLKHPLHNENLSFSLTRGVSNVMQGALARVSLADGLLLLVHTDSGLSWEKGGEM